MSKQFINEVSRMKDLFGYKRGVVISEQTQNTDFSKFPCLSSFKTEKKQTSKLGKDIIEELKIGTGNLKQYMFGADGTLYSYGAEYGTWKCGSNDNTININGKDVNVGVNTTNTTTNPATTSKDIYLTPPELKQNVGNKTGVQAFHDWLDENHSGWHSKYQTLNGSVPKGYGKFGPSTTKAWATYKKEYLEKNPNLVADVKTLPLTPQSEQPTQPGQDTTQPGQDTTQPGQPSAPPSLANATPKKTVDMTLTSQTPEQIYKILYDGNKVEGDPEGQGRIRIDVNALNDDQKEKLKQYMPKLGYEYYRTKNRDGRFVFTKVRQQGEE